MDSCAAAPCPDEQQATVLDRGAGFPIVPIVWFFGLLVLLFVPVLKDMVIEWATVDEMGHGFFVPLVAGYIIWNDRQHILSLPVRPCRPAALLIVWGTFQMALGFMGAEFLCGAGRRFWWRWWA